MKEIRSIIQAYARAREEGRRSALATVVHVRGSAYRRPGARMLIGEDGRLTGAISGGCLEGDAMRKALHAIGEQRPSLVTYDTMDDDDATLGIGLGCNGVIQVLIEPIQPDDPANPLALLEKAAARRQAAVLTTFFSLSDRRKPQPGTCLFLGQDGAVHGSCPPLIPAGKWRQEALAALESGCSSWMQHTAADGSGLTAFHEFVPPAVNLVVAGAGNDVLPLVEMANLLGWEVRVVDGRANYARPERFGSACQVLLARPEEVLQHIFLDSYTIFALMTHNYNYDKALLAELCRRNARYIAMLGPRKKIARMLEEFESEGRPLSLEQVASIFSPAGLDIGAETSEEIALSILSEMKAFLSARQGTSLREKSQPIHM